MHIKLNPHSHNHASKSIATEFFKELDALRNKYPMCYVEAWTPDDFDIAVGSITLTNEKHFHYMVATLAKQGTLAGILSPSSQEWETIADWHAPHHPMSVDCISTSRSLSEARDELQPFLFSFEDLADEDVVENGLPLYHSHKNANGTIFIGETD